MDGKDERTLQLSLPALIGSLNYDGKFKELLISKGVFSAEQIKAFQNAKNPVLEMLLKLMHGKQQDLQLFKDALKETGQEHCLQILEDNDKKIGSTDTDSRPMVDTNVLAPPNTDTVVLNQSESTPKPAFQIKVKPALQVNGAGDPNVYHCNTETSPRGLVLILNFYKYNDPEYGTREGSENDVINLRELFSQFGYQVEDHKDLSYSGTLQVVQDFRNRDAHKQADSTIITIMSHGGGGSAEEGTCFVTSDGCVISSERIIEYFNTYDCPSLAGKPKLFLFQFCRGTKKDVPPKASEEPRSDLVRDNFPEPKQGRKISDMLVVHSTPPGFVSYRERFSGTWFGEAICRVFMEYACNYDVKELLEKVDEYVEELEAHHGGRQTIVIENRGFHKKFYLNPGLVVTRK